MPLSIGKKEELIFQIIEQMALLEVRLKEVELAAYEMYKIKQKIDLITASFEKYNRIVSPIIEKELENSNSDS